MGGKGGWREAVTSRIVLFDQLCTPMSFYNEWIEIIRMHSSGMRTTHLLTVSQHALHRGVSAQEGVSATPCDQRQTQPCGQTDTSENKTFANLVGGGVKSNSST